MHTRTYINSYIGLDTVSDLLPDYIAPMHNSQGMNRWHFKQRSTRGS